MTKNKKAILEKEGMSLLLVLICIGLLIYVGVRVTKIVISQNELEVAKIRMNEIMNLIEKLEKSDGGREEYLMYSPIGWSLTGWPVNPLFSGEQMPEECKKNNWKKCLCLCRGVASGAGKILEKCNSFSICKEIKQENFRVNPGNFLGIPYDIYPMDVDKLVKDKEILAIEMKKETDGKTSLILKPDKETTAKK